MKAMHSIGLASALAVTLACRPAAPKEKAHPHEGEEAHAEGKDEHGHADEAEGEAAVRIASVRGIRLIAVPEPREEGAWFPGEAIADESAEIVLSSPVAGIVESAPSSPGRPARRGDVLLRVASPELADLKGRWLTAGARRERAEAELSREERLSASGATSRRELEAARGEAAAARADEEAARLGLTARGFSPEAASATFSLRAPAAGSVVAWRVRLGQGVAAGEELGRFQSGSAALVKLELPLPGPSWRLGDRTEVRSSDGRRWQARVDGLPAALGESNRRLTYRLRLAGGSLPMPGKPVEAHVPFAAGVILPQGALQQVEGSWGVFVRDGELARFRPVRRGTELGGDVMVLDGVKAGEEVVAEGAYLLKAALLKRKSGGDDHDH